MPNGHSGSHVRITFFLEEKTFNQILEYAVSIGYRQRIQCNNTWRRIERRQAVRYVLENYTMRAIKLILMGRIKPGYIGKKKVKMSNGQRDPVPGVIFPREVKRR